MRFLQGFKLFLSFPILSLAQPTSTIVSSVPQSTACGTIVNDPNNTIIFNASLAYECLTSVPFNADVATRFLQYYHDTLQFQSTLEYLKQPPPSYQQPAVDLLAGLDELQTAINNGLFPNQYEFEAALQTLLYAAHDSHVDLFAGVLAAFSFGSPYDIVSLSRDGVELPKVYLAYDLFNSSYFVDYQPSAILSINGVNATTYLTEFAAKNSVGMLEPHADWNQLMLSAAQDIQGYFDVFSGGATFYPGDKITFTFENGSSITDNFIAVYNSPGDTGPLETGGDFYNFFVLGIYPASYGEDTSAASSAVPSITAPAASSTISATPTPSSWDSPAYPGPDVAQPDLGTLGGGFVSGYFLNTTSISVLSIPSFDEYGNAINTFHATIREFITQSKAAGLQKVVIDLQQNTGGQVLLAIDTFKQFFPSIDPFGGSRLRAHDAANIIGEQITDYFQSLAPSDDDFLELELDLTADEFVATTRIDATTGRAFVSWAEFFGPHNLGVDNFTTTQRYNLSSAIFDQSATNDTFSIYGYGSNLAPPNAVPPYAAADIVLLSDGVCDSSCALFVEMMHHEAGVRTIVAGGRPSTGPMQTPSGSRGATDYPLDVLDDNIELAQFLLEEDNSTDAYFLPNRTTENSVFVTFADINLRDQVRMNETIPLQFAYEAADCRIFYTPQTIYNYTALWQYAADAIWADSGKCVAGSTGFNTTGANTTNFVGPSPGTPGTLASLSAYLENIKTSSIAYLTNLNDGLEDGFPNTKSRKLITVPVPCIVGFAKCKNGNCIPSSKHTEVYVGNQLAYKGTCPVVKNVNVGKASVGPTTTEKRSNGRRIRLT